MELRPARLSDSRMVWEWANDPDTRTASFNEAVIPWKDHVEWFNSHDMEIGWVPVGVVRVEDGKISVNVAPEQRKRGYGVQLIRAASLPNTRAEIKEGNAASLRVFKSAGYTEIARESGVITMVWPGLA